MPRVVSVGFAGQVSLSHPSGYTAPASSVHHWQIACAARVLVVDKPVVLLNKVVSPHILLTALSLDDPGRVIAVAHDNCVPMAWLHICVGHDDSVVGHEELVPILEKLLPVKHYEHVTVLVAD